jgi:outer membrane protein OmpA-like peptidoglycan-associated protein
MPAGLDEEGDAKLQQGDKCGGVPLMRFATKRHGIALLAVASLAVALPIWPALAQTAAPAPDLLEQLIGPETPADIDVVALRQQAADRVKSRADAAVAKRPPIVPQLLKLPQFEFKVAFDPDTAVIRPQSYQLIGRIADALSDPKLRPYAFLVVTHTAATGGRADNLVLSQRRADAIRSALTGSFKIPPRRIQALGLGEEQLQDSARPASETNLRVQLVSTGKVPPPVATQPAAGSVPPAKKGAAAKSKKRQ